MPLEYIYYSNIWYLYKKQNNKRSIMGANQYSEQVSEFNDAIGTTARFAGLFSAINISAMNLDLYTWYRALRRIRMELSSDMKPTEEQTTGKALEEIKPKIIPASPKTAQVSRPL